MKKGKTLSSLDQNSKLLETMNSESRHWEFDKSRPWVETGKILVKFT